MVSRGRLEADKVINPGLALSTYVPTSPHRPDLLDLLEDVKMNEYDLLSIQLPDHPLTKQLGPEPGRETHQKKVSSTSAPAGPLNSYKSCVVNSGANILAAEVPVRVELIGGVGAKRLRKPSS